MGATLLLADDSITIQRVIELTFADEDVRVVVAGDGQQAIEKIEAEHPDIVLADIGMPRVDGYDVAAHVKHSAALKHIPVLLLTGAFEPIDEARARQTGCDGVLVKPFEPQKLVARVKELLAGARAAELWPADMPRAQVPVEIAPLPELLREPQQEVPAPPLSMPMPSVAAPDDLVDIDPAIDPAFDLSERALAPAEQADALEGDDVAHRYGDHVPGHARPELPPPADRLETELDMLDAALSRLEPTAHPHELDEETASEFARDLNDLRSEVRHEDRETMRPASRPSFGNWDLPKPGPGDVPSERPIDILAEEIPLQAAPTPQAPPTPQASPVVQAPSQRVQASSPSVQTPPPSVQAPSPVVRVPIAAAPVHPEPALPSLPVPPAAPSPAPRPERPTLAAAFSALLAAEKSRPAAQAAPPQISEAAIEEVVKRVLARMAGDTVNRVVLETAERMIREEISRTKDPSGR